SLTPSTFTLTHSHSIFLTLTFTPSSTSHVFTFPLSLFLLYSLPRSPSLFAYSLSVPSLTYFLTAATTSSSGKPHKDKDGTSNASKQIEKPKDVQEILPVK